MLGSGQCESVVTGAPPSELLGRRSACLKLSSSEAACTRMTFGCLEGGSQISGSSGLAVWDTTTLASIASASRNPGEGMILHVHHHVYLLRSPLCTHLSLTEGEDPITAG